MSMIHHITAHLERFDEDEDGAILLACLAGCLIVFMVSLTMYDAGNVTREKIKLQTATDAAAYSQASVKARTMNTNAYVNVTKRSILGIQLTYFTAQNYFFSDMWTRFHTCETTQPPPPASYCSVAFEQVPCSSAEAAATPTTGTCATGDMCCNIFIASREHQRDFVFGSGGASTSQNFGGDRQNGAKIKVCTADPDPDDPNAPVDCEDAPGLPTRSIFMAATVTGEASSLEAAKLQGAMDKYTKEMRQLTRYQEYMQTITPWWAFSEALTRATFNGATMATAYPPPAWFDQSSPAGNYPTGPAPASQMEEDWKFPTTVGLVSGRDHASLATQFDSFGGNMCSQFTGGPDQTQPFVDPLFNQEVEIHVATLKRNSDGAVNNSDTYARQIFAGDNLTSPLKTIGGYSACYMMQTGRHSAPCNDNDCNKPGSWLNKNTMETGHGMVPLIDPTYSTPYLVSVDPSNSELDRMRLSNIVFGYKEGSDYRRDIDGSGTGMTRFEYMTQNYTNSLPPEAQGTGIWTMARGEIVTLGDSDGNWHAAWTARVRPIARPGELSAVESDMSMPSGNFLNNAFRAATPYLRVNAQIAHTSGEHHQEVWQSETTTMERATKAMDSDSSGGFFK